MEDPRHHPKKTSTLVLGSSLATFILTASGAAVARFNEKDSDVAARLIRVETLVGRNASDISVLIGEQRSMADIVARLTVLLDERVRKQGN